MAFAIKTEVGDPRAHTFAFTAQKTMYGGKHIAEGDPVFVFASENEGGAGLIARGVVTSVEANPKKRGIARHSPISSLPICPRARPCALGSRRSAASRATHRRSSRAVDRLPERARSGGTTPVRPTSP